MSLLPPAVDDPTLSHRDLLARAEPRADAPDKLDGRLKYPTDRRVPDLLHGAVLGTAPACSLCECVVTYSCAPDPSSQSRMDSTPASTPGSHSACAWRAKSMSRTGCSPGAAP